MSKHAGGRPRLPIDRDQVLRLYAQPGQSVTSIARTLGVDRSRVRRVVAEAGVLRNDRGHPWTPRKQGPPR